MPKYNLPASHLYENLNKILVNWSGGRRLSGINQFLFVGRTQIISFPRHNLLDENWRSSYLPKYIFPMEGVQVRANTHNRNIFKLFAGPYLFIYFFILFCITSTKVGDTGNTWNIWLAQSSKIRNPILTKFS